MTKTQTKPNTWTPKANPSPANTPVEEVLFLDIETVPIAKELGDISPQGQTIFYKRFKKELEECNGQNLYEEAQKVWTNKAALTSEFSQIVCISLGVIVPGQVPRLLRVKSFAGDNEENILRDIEQKLFNAKYLCAHNGKRFDFPLLVRKLIQHKIALPSVLNIIGLKPWEVRLFDTMEVWQFTGNDNASLDALAYALGLPSPKTDLSGADVAPLFFGEAELPWDKEDAIKRIAAYCEGDILTMVNAYLRMIGQGIISPENVVIV